MGGAFGGVDLEIATAEDLGAREKGGGEVGGGGRRRAGGRKNGKRRGSRVGVRGEAVGVGGEYGRMKARSDDWV